MNSKLLGGILLIVGTSIGAGMLALPVSSAETGFMPGIMMLFGCWMLMTFGAFLILEVNLWLPPGNNIISMTRSTLGVGGEIVAWVSYLLLLYSLVAAYTAGGRDIVEILTRGTFGGIFANFPRWGDALIFAGLLGFVVYLGVYFVDLVNRGFMSLKLVIYFILVFIISRHVKITHFADSDFTKVLGVVTVMITSFGYATIIPTLRTYLDSDVKKLRLAILIGSAIPLLVYLSWMVIVMGIIPRFGAAPHTLTSIFEQDTSATSVAWSLQYLINTNGDWISILTRIFSSLAISTSFLGVTLCLSDFLADGLKIRKQGLGKLTVTLLAIVPPVLILLFYPKMFLTGIQLAGLSCVVLLVLLPVLMVWSGRYVTKIASGYRVIGGKPALILTLLFAIGAMAIGIFHDLELFSF